MKRIRTDSKQMSPRKVTPVATDALANVRGGHGIIDPTAGAFQNLVGGTGTTYR
jgi:hypothetical protein